MSEPGIEHGFCGRFSRLFPVGGGQVSCVHRNLTVSVESSRRQSNLSGNPLNPLLDFKSISPYTHKLIFRMCEVIHLVV